MADIDKQWVSREWPNSAVPAAEKTGYCLMLLKFEETVRFSDRTFYGLGSSQDSGFRSDGGSLIQLNRTELTELTD